MLTLKFYTNFERKINWKLENIKNLVDKAIIEIISLNVMI